MPTPERLRTFAKYAVEKTCILRSLKVSLLVGTVLALINHYDELLSGSLGPKGLGQVLVTYAVPYCVATFGSASQAVQMKLAVHQGSTASETSGNAPRQTVIASPNRDSEEA